MPSMGTEAIHFIDPPEGGVEVLFVAGEHSGDQHAAEVARALQRLEPEWRMLALGGPALRLAGAPLLHDLTRDAVVGLVEVLKNYGHFKALFEALVDWIGRHRPRVVVLVDYPGFNLRLAKELKARGISRKGGGNVAIYQYVSPQIWAWKAGRRFKMAETLDELGAIFPFEVEAYADTELPVRFVGHPFSRSDYHNPVRYDPEGPVLLLPGSRRQAVERIFPIMLQAVSRLRERGVRRRCVCLYPDEAIHRLLESLRERGGMPEELVQFRSVETGTTAAAVLTSSGTMSLHCALAGIPGAVVYRAHPLTAFIGRRLIRIPWLGIANLVLNRSLYPEYLQGEAKPALLAGRLEALLTDPAAAAPFQEGALALKAALAPNASTGPAVCIHELVQAGMR